MIRSTTSKKPASTPWVRPRRVRPRRVRPQRMPLRPGRGGATSRRRREEIRRPRAAATSPPGRPTRSIASCSRTTHSGRSSTRCNRPPHRPLMRSRPPVLPANRRTRRPAGSHGRQKAAGHAASRRDGAAGAAGFLQLARRRPEGALQHDGPATLRGRAVNQGCRA